MYYYSPYHSSPSPFCLDRMVNYADFTSGSDKHWDTSPWSVQRTKVFSKEKEKVRYLYLVSYRISSTERLPNGPNSKHIYIYRQIDYVVCSSPSSESSPPAPGQRPRSIIKLWPKLKPPATAAHSPNFFNSLGFIIDELRYFVHPSGSALAHGHTEDGWF